MNEQEARSAFMAGAQAASPSDLLDGMLDSAFDAWWKGHTESYWIEELGLMVRVYNACRKNGIRTIGQLRAVLDPEGDVYIGDWKGMGLKSIESTKDQLRRWDEGEELW